MASIAWFGQAVGKQTILQLDGLVLYLSEKALCTAHSAHPDATKDFAIEGLRPKLPSGKRFARAAALRTNNKASVSASPSLRIVASDPTSSTVVIAAEAAGKAVYAGSIPSHLRIFKWPVARVSAFFLSEWRKGF